MLDALSNKIQISRKKNKGQPLYEQIRRQLHNAIESEGLVDGDRLPAISLLADRLNVNYRTIKSALDLLEKDAVVRWERNKGVVVVSRQNNKPVNTITISTVRMICDAFCIGISEGIFRFAEEHGVRCIMVDAGGSHERFLDAIRSPCEEIDGVLVTPYEMPEYHDAVATAISKGVKVVFVDRILPDLEVSSVKADHFLGGYMITKHLIEAHGRPVYHLGTIEKPSSCRDWVRGWNQAMQEYNYFDSAPYLFNIAATEAEMVDPLFDFIARDSEAAGAIFDGRKEDKYCIFAGNDYVGKSVYVAAEKRGLVVGKDVFVASFGDLPLAHRLPIPLTSVDQNPELVGYEAARVLYDTLRGNIVRPVHRLLPVTLCVRQSSTGRGDAGQPTKESGSVLL